jgi:hypothetical protein
MERDKRNVKGGVVLLVGGNLVSLLKGDVISIIRGVVFLRAGIDLEGNSIAESFNPSACLCLFRFECGVERLDREELGVVAWGRGWVRECMLPQLELPPVGELDFGKQVLASPWDP